MKPAAAKPTRLRMLAELFREVASKPLEQAQTKLAPAEAALLVELAALSDRAITTRYARMVKATANKLAGLPPPRGRGRPPVDYEAVADGLDAMREKFSADARAMHPELPDDFNFTDADVLLWLNAIVSHVERRDGKVNIFVKPEVTKADMLAIRESQTSEPVKIRRRISTVTTATSRVRSARKRAAR